MKHKEAVERVNELAEGLDAVLTAYREDIKGIFYLEIVADSLPDRWFAENIESRGPLWLALTREAFLLAEYRADNIEAEKTDGKEEEYSRKRILLAIATVLFDFSNALAMALKELEESEEE